MSEDLFCNGCFTNLTKHGCECSLCGKAFEIGDEVVCIEEKSYGGHAHKRCLKFGMVVKKHLKEPDMSDKDFKDFILKTEREMNENGN